MSDSQSKQVITPPPELPGGAGNEGNGVSAVSTDYLIEAGILGDIPPGYNPDQFCMALTTQMLGGQADLGAALLRVDSRGQWEMLGGFLELHGLGEKLHQQRSTSFPALMEALREGHAKALLSDPSFASLGLGLDGHLVVVGLSRPGLGVLLIGARHRLKFSPTALKLLVSVTEAWLSRGDSLPVHTATIAQVNGDNSGVIFTDRQLAVLSLLADGNTNTEIGRALSISASLAKQEVAFLAHALQAKNRLDVVVQAQRQGILPVSPG